MKHGLGALEELAVGDFSPEMPQSISIGFSHGLLDKLMTLEAEQSREQLSELQADLASLVRYAVQLDDELVPYAEQVQARYLEWLAAQQAACRTFTPEQRWWLDEIAQPIGVNLEAQPEGLDYGEFFNRGGRMDGAKVFGTEWMALVDELNASLAV